MLINGSFKDNVFTTPPTGVSGLMPKPWYLRFFATKDTPWVDHTPVGSERSMGKQGQDWNAPEVIPVTYPFQFPERELVADAGDNTIFKVFRGGAPFWCEIAQDVEPTPGEYVLTVPIFPDQWHVIKDKRVRPSPLTSEDWYYASEVQVEAYSGQKKLASTGWRDARQVPIGKYTPIQLSFMAPEIVTVVIGMRAIWGFQQNGYFLDGITLLPVSSIPVEETFPYHAKVWTEMGQFGIVRAGLVETVTDKQRGELSQAEAILQRLIGLKEL